jgi:DNA-binding NtrC family response regulator
MSTVKNILVVDDEANLRATLSLILKRAGYETHAVANGRDAIGLITEFQFDLVLLDLKMPGIDGMQLLHQLHRLYPALPVLILTSNTSLESAVQAIRSGALGYMLKPIEPEQIIHRIQEIFAEQLQLKRRHEIVNDIKGIVAEIKQMEI